MITLRPAIAAVAVGTAFLTVGVTGASAATKLSGEITFVTQDSNAPADRYLAAAFQKKYPGVKVNYQPIPGGAVGLNTVLAPQLQGGGGPDVFMVFAGRGINPSGIRLFEAGRTSDLSKAPWVKRTPKIVKQLNTTRGKTFMAMTPTPTSAMMYDVNKFRELKLKVPKTWKELLALCRTIRQKSPSTIPFATGGSQFSFNAVIASIFAGQTVYSKDPRWDGKRQRNQTTFAGTAGWRAALQRFVDMKNNNCLSPGVATDTNASSVAQVATGRAVMMAGPSLYIPQLQAANPNGKYSTFPVPGDTAKQTRLMIFLNQAYTVNKNAKNPAAARAFVDFFSTTKIAAAWGRLGGGVSLSEVGNKKPKVASEFSSMKPLLAKSRTVLGPFANWPTGSTFDTMGRVVQTIYTGQATVSEALARLDSTWAK